MRRLLITRRTVERGRTAPYSDTWVRLRNGVESAGGRAWRFRSEGRPHDWIEFIEWAGPQPLPELQPVAAARAELDAMSPGNSDVWVEAPA